LKSKSLYKNSKKVVLHLTESGGGVLEYVKKIVESTPDISHILVMRKRLSFSNLDLSNIQNLQIEEWDGNLFKGIFKAINLYHKNNANYMHLHSSLAGLARLTSTKIRFIYSPHCYAFERQDFPFLVRATIFMIESFLSVNTDKYMCVSKREKKLTKRFLKNSEILTVNFPISAWDSQYPANYIVCIGRICSQKNPHEFIKIASIFRLKNPGIKFIWLGDGDLDLRKQLEKNQIQVMGWLQKEKLYTFISEAIAVLHTALWEGMPVIFSEVMASGVPLIVRDSRYLGNFGEPYIYKYSTVDEAVEWIHGQLSSPNRLKPLVFSREEFAKSVCKLYLT
jgi:glycosyltransferase involved in cell wall biosynthesis